MRSFVAPDGVTEGARDVAGAGCERAAVPVVPEVLDGATVTAVAARFGVARQTVHVWLRRYATEGAVLNLEDRPSRPHLCPHQMPASLEVDPANPQSCELAEYEACVCPPLEL